MDQIKILQYNYFHIGHSVVLTIAVLRVLNENNRMYMRQAPSWLLFCLFFNFFLLRSQVRNRQSVCLRFVPLVFAIEESLWLGG